MDEEGISLYELAKKANLHPSFLYVLLKRKQTERTRPVQRKTIVALAEAVGYSVTFDSKAMRITLTPTERPSRRSSRRDIDQLIQELRKVLEESSKRLTLERRREIVEVVRVLVS